MNKNKLVARLKRIREQARINMLKLAIFSAAATSPAVTSVAETEGSKPNYDFKAIEVSYAPEDLTIRPEAVNIAPAGWPKPIYEFENKVFDKNDKKVADYAEATRYSLWDCSYKREVGNKENPVGIVDDYYGSLQFNRFNAENMAIYALEHPDYSDFTDKFFDKRPGFDKALQAFRDDFAAKGKKFSNCYLAYHVGCAPRKRLASYLKSDFRNIFRSLGKQQASKFLRLQRDYASEVYCTFDGKNLQRIVSTLADAGIKPEQVNPAVWGMFLAKHIKGGFNGIAKLLEGKKVEEINSKAFVDEVANAFPDVFKKFSGKEAHKFAREHYGETHSITTMKELSVIVKQPEIFQNYIQDLAHNQNGTLTWEQSVQLTQANLGGKAAFRPVARPQLKLSVTPEQLVKPEKITLKPQSSELSKAVVKKKSQLLAR